MSEIEEQLTNWIVTGWNLSEYAFPLFAQPDIARYLAGKGKTARDLPSVLLEAEANTKRAEANKHPHSIKQSVFWRKGDVAICEGLHAFCKPDRFAGISWSVHRAAVTLGQRLLPKL